MKKKINGKVFIIFLIVLWLSFFSFWMILSDTKPDIGIDDDKNGNYKEIENNEIIHEELYSLNYKDKVYFFIKTCDYTKDYGLSKWRTTVKCYNGDSITDVTDQFVDYKDQRIYPRPFVFDNKLYLAKWSYNYGVILKTFDGSQWSEPFNSSSKVTIVESISFNYNYYISDITIYNNKIYFIWVKQNTNGIFVQTYDGSSWSEVDYIEWDGLFDFEVNKYNRCLLSPLKTAIIDNKMCVICSIGTHEHERYISIRYLENNEWSVPTEQAFPNNYYTNTILDFVVFQNSLIFFWHDINKYTSDIHIKMISYDLNNWSTSITVSDFSNQVFYKVLNEYPDMIIYNNKLFVSWRISNRQAITCGAGENPIYIFVRTFDGTNWSAPINLSYGNWRETIIFDDKLYITNKNGQSTNIYNGESWIAIDSPGTWSRDVHLAVFKDKLLFIVKENSSVWTLFNFDGKQWCGKINVTS